MSRHDPAVALGRTAAAAVKAGVDTATTLSLRMPLLFAAPDFGSMLEWQRAWTEKVTAMTLGAVGAGAACHALSLRAATGAVTADTLVSDMLTIADAALAPGYKTVAANARRLSRGR